MPIINWEVAMAVQPTSLEILAPPERENHVAYSLPSFITRGPARRQTYNMFSQLIMPVLNLPLPSHCLQQHP